MDKLVLVMGTFDIPHMGHAIFLKKCSEYGKVIVAINSDKFVSRFKRKPVYTELERANLIEMLGYEVVPNVGDEDATQVINLVKPDIIIQGSDWAHKDWYTQVGFTHDFLDERGIDLIYVPYTKEISTSDIIKRCAKLEQ